MLSLCSLRRRKKEKRSFLILTPIQMGKNILAPLQQEEQDLGHPRQEHVIIIEKNLEKFYRKINQMMEQGRYPRGGDFSLVMERWNADLDGNEIGDG